MKKRKALMIAVLAVLVVLAAVLVWYFVWGRNKTANSRETTVKIETSAGQEVIFAQLTSVKGNEITYKVAEKADHGEMPSRPEGDKMPDMSQMPEGKKGGRGDMNQGGNRGGQGSQNAYAFSYDDINYRLTEESRTDLIPVGTDVVTKLGTVTTFSRLAAGDNVALVVQNDEGEEQAIVAVYIIG